MDGCGRASSCREMGCLVVVFLLFHLPAQCLLDLRAHVLTFRFCGWCFIRGKEHGSKLRLGSSAGGLVMMIHCHIHLSGRVIFNYNTLRYHSSRVRPDTAPSRPRNSDAPGGSAHRS